MPHGPAHCTCWLRVRATGVPYRTCRAPWHPRPLPAYCPLVNTPGVNGIRKTSAVYQPWFKRALSQALEAGEGGEAARLPTEEELPDGNDSYFRQLDYMIATVALTLTLTLSLTLTLTQA